MPIAPFEKSVLRLLAANRNPESFVAGATVLLRADDSHRRSQDIDLFHDTAESIKVAAEGYLLQPETTPLLVELAEQSRMIYSFRQRL